MSDTVEVPDLLPGPTAGRLSVAASAVMFCAIPCVVAFGLESYLGRWEPLWIAVWSTVFAVAVATGGALRILAMRKRERERNAGYTTSAADLDVWPSLFLIDYSARTVVGIPEWASEANPGLAAAPQPRHRALRWLIVGSGAVGIAATIVGWYSVAAGQDSGRADRPTPTLSHTTAEQRIEVFGGAASVICNGGRDIPLTRVGQTFTCVNSTGGTYTATITKLRGAEFTFSAS